MKRLLFVAFWATQILVCKTNAQEVSITGVSPESFSGVRSVNNGELYYVAYMDANSQDSANVAVRIFDRGMQPRREINVPVSKGTQLAASAFTGQFYIVQLVNVGNKTRTMLVLDEGGNVFKRKDEADIKASALSAARYSTIYPISPNDYVIIRTNRDGKAAFEMEGMDAELTSRWQKTLDGRPGFEVLDLKTEMDRIFLLQKDDAGVREDYSVRVLNGMGGDDFFSTEIREAENIAIPAFIDVKNGFIATAGIFQREPSPGKSAGLFFAKLDPTGRPEKLQFIPWSLIKTQVKNSIISDLESGKAGVQIQNVIPDAKDEGFTLLGELYTKTAGVEAATATFSVQDFILVHINKDGQPDRVSQISKPVRSLMVKGAVSNKNATELAQWLDSKRFFGYRAVVPTGDKTVIAYLDNKKGKATGYFATLDSIGTAPQGNITTLDFDRQEGGNTRARKTDKSAEDTDIEILSSTEQDVRDFAAARAAKDIVPVQDGQVMMLNYTAPDLRFWIIPVPVRQ
ncbi:hypothetical protein [Polluticoccus soli]|uniref:hypothetical protein n=1 Tax=Polluticoccus soli TaxID=3034150 RepID=UPI0023E314B1|nr:hypothetical protein [Flavipsychrobacter sp. JY13-12]